jgi:hypothetical protein
MKRFFVILIAAILLAFVVLTSVLIHNRNHATIAEETVIAPPAGLKEDEVASFLDQNSTTAAIEFEDGKQVVEDNYRRCPYAWAPARVTKLNCYYEVYYKGCYSPCQVKIRTTYDSWGYARYECWCQ